MMKHSLKLKFLSTLILLSFLFNRTFSQSGNFSSEDLNNTGIAFEYDQPDLTLFKWDSYPRVASKYADITSGIILKNITARQTWGSPLGLYPVWYNPNEYVFNLPIVVGGQIMLQWKDCEKSKGVYDFTKLDKMLSVFFSKKLYATIQINGNLHPDWMYNEIPYLANAQLSSQVSDPLGTLMYWYPLYVESYTNLLTALSNYLKTSTYLKCVNGIRFNLNAIGTEHTTPPKAFLVNSQTINAQINSNYTFPALADRSFTKDWTSGIFDSYEKKVFTAYDSLISPIIRVYLRNNLDNAIMMQAQPGLNSGKIGLFHTSSEPEPRSSGGEDKLIAFNNYSRNLKTISYAEPWADPWGVHSDGSADPHFCSPEQWNYWRILCDLNVGISQIAMHGSYWFYAMGEPGPNSTQFTVFNDSLRRAQIRRGIEFAYKYVGQHNNPTKSPGAFVAFRQSSVNLSIKNNPSFYGNTSSAITTFTGDYSFLAIRKPDNTIGVKLQGGDSIRYGAFARSLPVGQKMDLVFHPQFTKAIYNKPLKLRIIYLDGSNEKWTVNYGTYSFTVQNGGTKQWKVMEWNVMGAPRVNPLTVNSIIEKGELATNTELNSLNSDISITSITGNPIFHMVELDRSTTFTNMYKQDLITSVTSPVLKNSLIKVIQHPSGIEIQNIEPKVKVEVYTTLGLRIYSAYSNGENVRVNLNSKGVYLLKIDNFAKQFIF